MNTLGEKETKLCYQIMAGFSQNIKSTNENTLFELCF